MNRSAATAMRSKRAASAWAILALAGFFPTAADDTTPAAADGLVVTYVTAESVYVGAGSDAGLRAGDRLEVLRGGMPVAVLEVQSLSSRRALCRVVEGTIDVVVGDAVRPLRTPEPGAAPASAPPAPAPTSRGATTDGLTHGRVGLRYLWMRDREAGGLGYSQPGIDFRMDGHDLAGGWLDLLVDVRTRRTYRNIPGESSETSNRTRVYSAAAAWHDPGSRTRVTVGRQYSPSLTAVSTFDGALVEWNRERWNFGVFTGTQPSDEDFGFGGDVAEHGGFATLRSSRQKPGAWMVTSGLVGSYQDGTVNREFVFLQANFAGRRLSGFLTQEIDVNRDWKAEAGESTVAPTSTFVTLGYRPSRHWDLHGGLDNRRNVRLYRDHLTPEVEFDDHFREGAWLGASFLVDETLRVGVDAKSSTGGSAGSADAVTVNVRSFDMTDLALALGYRGTWYGNDRSDGWLHVVTAGIRPRAGIGLGLHGGLREERGTTTTFPDRRLSWIGIDLDVDLGRRWFLILAVERSSGDLENNDQVFSSVSYRF